MSMSYELMMRKKVEEMPLTKVGSPTITDGVVSGFSADDYIADNNSFDITSNFEIKTKINYWENTGSSQYIMSLRGSVNLSVYFGSTGTSIAAQYGSSYWTGLASGLTVGSPLDIIIKGDGTNISITIKQGSYTNTSTKTISELGLTGNYDIYWGRSGTGLPFTSGIIDFNNSYEIRNGTKYIFTIGE